VSSSSDEGKQKPYAAAPDLVLPVLRHVVQLAKEYRLFLHSLTGADAIDRQFKQDPNARILWCDLAFRSDHAKVVGRSGKVEAGWRAAFLEFPDRFMVGTDSFTPERWYRVAPSTPSGPGFGWPTCHPMWLSGSPSRTLKSCLHGRCTVRRS